MQHVLVFNTMTLWVSIVQTDKQSRTLRTANARRRVESKFEVLLHSDAAQAVGKIPVDVNDLGVDYLTVAGHKFYGPRIGALYRRTNCPLSPVGTGLWVDLGASVPLNLYPHRSLSVVVKSPDIGQGRKTSL